MATGMREKDGHTELGTSPANAFKDTIVQRIAEITLAPDGSVTGTVTFICTGQFAARWRQKALQGDQVALKKDFDDEMQSDLTPGLTIHSDHFLGLDSQDTNLMIRMNVSGSLGTATGKRIFLPLSIFTAGAHNPFSSSHREEPIDLHYPLLEKDQVNLHLPAGFQVESVPEKTHVNLAPMAGYAADAKADGQTITFTRSYIMANVLYKADEYDKLKGFFDDVSNKDRAQAVLHLAAASHQGQ